MILLPPEVKGPISTCSQQVRVRGQIAGARVTLLVNGEPAGSAVCHWPDDVVGLDEPLAPGDEVTARQEYEEWASPQSPSQLPAVAQVPPATLAGLTVRTLMHQCGTAIWLEGVVPGAAVDAVIDGEVVGSGTSVDGTARLTYAPGLEPGHALSLRQTTCTGVSNVTDSPRAIPIPQPLPVPLVTEPLYECMTAIRIGQIADGATVTIHRDSGEQSAAFDRSALTWIGVAPLVAGEVVKVDQAFHCRVADSRRVRQRDLRRVPIRIRPKATTMSADPTHVSEATAVEVLPADSLPAPVIWGPVCPDPKLITISNLVPSARVILYRDGEPVAMADAPGYTHSFSGLPLPAGSQLSARLQLCGKDGPMSAPVAVQADSPLAQLGVSRLYACASHITISDVGLTGSNKIVYARNQAGEPISAYHQVHTRIFQFPVSPALTEGDEITIVVLGCGASAQEFGPFPVLAAPEPTPVILEPVTEGSTVVWVDSAISGAVVRVLVDGVPRGEAISQGDQFYTPVGLGLPRLALGQEVIATETICGRMTRSVPVQVVVPRPYVPRLTQPIIDAVGVPAKPVEFKWIDPGSATSAAAERFEIQIFRDGSQVAGGEVTATEFIVDLPYSQRFDWKVIAFNQTGFNGTASHGFTTEQGAPETPPEQPPTPSDPAALLVFGTDLLVGHQLHTNAAWLTPNTGLYFFTLIANIGSAASAPCKVEFLWQDSDGNASFAAVDLASLVPGESRWAHHHLPAGLPAGDWYIVVAIVVNGVVVNGTFSNRRVGS